MTSPTTRIAEQQSYISMLQSMGSEGEVCRTRANQFLSRFESVKENADRLGVEPCVLAGGALGLILLLAWGLLGGDFLIKLFMFVHPALQSYQGILSQSAETNIRWLQYWVVLALFLLGDSLFGVLLNWIPLFSLARFAFIGWLQYPAASGAAKVYQTVVTPLMESPTVAGLKARMD